MWFKHQFFCGGIMQNLESLMFELGLGDIAINIKFPYGLILHEISLLYCNDSISCPRCSFTFGTSRDGAREGNVQSKPSLIFIKKEQ